MLTGKHQKPKFGWNFHAIANIFQQKNAKNYLFSMKKSEEC